LAYSQPGDPLRQVRASLETSFITTTTNIDLEKQVAEMTKNQLLQNFALTVMTINSSSCKPRLANGV